MNDYSKKILFLYFHEYWFNTGLEKYIMYFNHKHNKLNHTYLYCHIICLHLCLHLSFFVVVVIALNIFALEDFVCNTISFLFAVWSTSKSLMWSWRSLLSLNVLTNLLKAKVGIHSYLWKKCLQQKMPSLPEVSCLQLPLRRISVSQFKNLSKFPQSHLPKTSHSELLVIGYHW